MKNRHLSQLFESRSSSFFHGNQSFINLFNAHLFMLPTILLKNKKLGRKGDKKLSTSITASFLYFPIIQNRSRRPEGPSVKEKRKRTIVPTAMVFNESISEVMSFNDTCIDDTSLYNVTESMSIPPCHIFKDPSYYALPYRVIGTIFQGFILIVGKF